MKNVFVILTGIIAIVLLTANFACAQSGKTLVKTINPSLTSASASTCIINVCNADVEFVEWDEKTIRVETFVQIDQNEKILDFLAIKLSRYSLSCNTDNGVMTISMKKLKNQIFIKGKQLTEKISIKVFVPEGFIKQTGCDEVASK